MVADLITDVSPVGIISPFETKMARPAEHHIVAEEPKIFLVDH